MPDDEAARLAALRSLGLLDTEPDERFDRITRMAQRILDVPIALVSLVDADRQWFKSRQGLDRPETSRSVAFCAHAIAQHDVMVVEDATADPRFADNPLVTGDPEVRFYAGAPISGPDGHVLGTLCVMDRRPRTLDARDRQTLEDLAEMVQDEIEYVQLAISDELTGLSNRRGMDFLGRQVLAVCARQGSPALLLYVDVDRFKEINDEHGHQAGDRALKAVAHALVGSFRHADVLARLGGDEFAALLAGADDVTVPMERFDVTLRRAAAEAGFPISVSIGSAVFDPADPADLDDLLAQADASMYEDKTTEP